MEPWECGSRERVGRWPAGPEAGPEQPELRGYRGSHGATPVLRISVSIETVGRFLFVLFHYIFKIKNLQYKVERIMW